MLAKPCPFYHKVGFGAKQPVTFVGQGEQEKQASPFATPRLLQYNPLEHRQQLRT
jgi:hypothetical protein